MKFRVYRSSIIWHGKPCEGAYKCTDDPSIDDWRIEIQSLEDLKKMQKSIGRHTLIIDFDPLFPSEDCDGTIEIYDSYRE